MDERSPTLKADLIARLRRVEGQVKGVQRMLEEDRECPQVLQQLAAIRAAVHQTSLLLAHAYLDRCLTDGEQGNHAEVLDQLMSTLAKLE